MGSDFDAASALIVPGARDEELAVVHLAVHLLLRIQLLQAPLLAEKREQSDRGQSELARRCCCGGMYCRSDTGCERILFIGPVFTRSNVVNFVSNLSLRRSKLGEFHR